jgi:TATA-box binding protein (TBP) (component of TFIID and TFIIIB)
LRYSVNHGKAYNVSGNQGVQLFFTNGKKLLIGTQKPEEITAILKQINQLKN